MKNSHSSAFSFYFARKFYRDKTSRLELNISVHQTMRHKVH